VEHNRLTPGRLYAGSSGFSYPSWKGGFYPADARPEEFLRHYGARLPSVELNTTFYNLPAEAQFERWAEAVPPDFRFAVTMSRRVTSRGRVEGVQAFEQSIRALGDKLGPVRIRYVLDFRHDSWDAPEVSDVLAARGLARAGDTEGEAPFRYLRLREPPYEEADLKAWAERLGPVLASGADVYCYFKHEDEPTAPRYAERLLALSDSP
jgi:uncharacterized protein YecE (DUF72 family)